MDWLHIDGGVKPYADPRAKHHTGKYSDQASGIGFNIESRGDGGARTVIEMDSKLLFCDG